MKKLYEAYKKALKKYEELDKLVEDGAWDLEAECDDAYDEMYKLFEAVVNVLVDELKIDVKTARAMVQSDRFEAIIAKEA